MARNLLAVLVCVAASGGALAQDCTIDRAVYRDTATGIEVRFIPVETRFTRAPSTSNLFTVSVPDFERELSGDVIWNMGLGRPNGNIMLDCPEDGFTEDDFAGCTIWSGVMYGLLDGRIVMLPEFGDAAPEQILLPDFGRHLRYGVWEAKFSTNLEPEDVLDFVSCQP